MKMKHVDVSGDPLSFWKVCRNELPALAKLERTYLNPSANSNDSEREFKMAKWIQKERVRLLLKNMETLLFLK